ncbi:hypothetical protein TVAG_489350 [Trichomonas vaginalis G3]|uniref:Vps16 N-terminal domain-containing protein n=1 Tax=Trichomonas vaginalis (strain ATCC PRA-98 / G3) TaxID=412133 RepID=A2EVE5_TRIV3|nr:vacuolar protein sorting VPSs16 family [Trichomonas vaginalis G3]EAY03391.1 hypothetical protein TVAG_489350 [Trichomonas vaginalis G3]KAI5538075.1 vacuolar protein sorting VPSs16 family [Trichomonas vaginalis G3]|eukprot:XP_001315614.1 hypothetical protein [Trichomonas vaginalis G3]
MKQFTMLTDPVYCGQFSKYKDMLDKSGEWMYTSEGKIEWVKVCEKTMDFPIEPFLDTYAMGKCTGLIAYWRKKVAETKIRPIVKVYDQNSNLISTIYVDYECYNIDLHVFMNDNVGVLADDGTVLIYSHQSQIKMQKLFKFSYVLRCAFHENGVVVFAKDGNIYECENFEKTHVITQHGFTERFKQLEIVPEQYSYTNGTLCFALAYEGELYLYSSKGSYKIDFDNPIETFAISTNYNYISILFQDKTMIVYDIKLSQEIYRTNVDFDIFGTFLFLKWLGELAPVAVFQDGLLFLSSDGTSPCYSFSGMCLAYSEHDSLFIQTQTESYRLIEVPENVSNVLSTMVSSDGAKLCQIFDERMKNPVLSMMNSEIDRETAKNECIDTALFLNDTKSRVFFLNAAELTENTKNLENKILRAKILLTLQKNCSMPLTNSQFEQLPLSCLSERLCIRHLHIVAAKIFERLDEKTTNISESYCCYVIDNILDDDNCLETLIKDDFVSISFAASYAIKKGRMNLAKNLTQKEQSYEKKSVLYSLINDWKNAFENCDLSCDSSSMIQVIANAIGYHDKNFVNNCIAENETICYFCIRMISIISYQRIRAILELNSTMNQSENLLRYYMSFSPDFVNKNVENLAKIKELQKVIGADIHDNDIVGLSFNQTIRKLAKNYLPETAILFAKESKTENRTWERIFVATLVDEKMYDKVKEFVVTKDRKYLWDLVVFLYLKNGEKNEIHYFISKCDKMDAKRAARLKQIAEGENYVKTINENPPEFRVFKSNSW